MALPYQEYVDMLGNNLNIHELHYKKFSIDKKIAAKISGYKRLIILIITEPWCGDSLALLPIIRKIAEVNGRWGPRPEATAQIFENHREQIAQGKIEKQDVIKKISFWK
jgi:hypothetical protein